jgi:hypothetical protein
MKKLMIAVALAFAMIGGAVAVFTAVFTVSSTYVAACPTNGYGAATLLGTPPLSVSFPVIIPIVC